MNSWTKDLTILTLIFGLFLGATLGKYPLSAPDGARYSEIPREMVVTGDYLTPHLNGVKYFEKPPLFYWMQAASIKAFGINGFATSLPNTLVILLCALCIYITSRKLYGRLEGLAASSIFITSGLVFALAKIITLDTALTLFITTSLCSFLLANRLPIGRKRTLCLWLMYAFSACAVMTKGLVGMGFLGVIIAIWITIFNKWRDLKNYHLISGTFIFLLIALPWHVLVQLRNPEFFNFYFVEQHLLRYFTDYASRSQKWWFFPVTALAGLFPWFVFLPHTVANFFSRKSANEITRSSRIMTFFSSLKNRLKINENTAFLLIWITVIFTIYNFSNSKLIPYILPIYPPIAILIANSLVKAWQSKKKTTGITYGFYTIIILNFILGIAAFVATFILDFNEHAITKQNLYTAGTAAFISAFVIFIFYRRYNIKTGFIALVASIAILYSSINPVITVINRQSIKPLITIIQEKIKPGDEVIAYGNYYQDLPFYLERIITVAEFYGELKFGVKHQENATKWMIDKKEFWKKWNSDKTIYLIASEGYYNDLILIDPSKMNIIAKLWNTFLLTNKRK